MSDYQVVLTVNMTLDGENVEILRTIVPIEDRDDVDSQIAAAHQWVRDTLATRGLERLADSARAARKKEVEP